MNGNHTTRVGGRFNKEIESIKDKRLEMKLDKMKRSTREITDLIVRHYLWHDIKKEIIEFDFKKGKPNNE